jgi:hypothetical protein
VDQGKPNPRGNALADVVFGPAFNAEPLAEVGWKAPSKKVKAL